MNSNSASSRIFISYSHRGNGPRWKAKLIEALGVFERHHLLDVWEDGKIRVSSFWDDDIKQAMNRARLAVVLLTKEALDSQFILEVEFPFLRERQQHDRLPVFPVVCEECNWRAHDWLRATQAPNESNPVAQLSESAQDRVFRKLATSIAENLSHLALAELNSPSPLAEISSPSPPRKGGEGRGEEARLTAGMLENRGGVDSDARTYLDKFPLTWGASLREEKLIGREQELALLDLALASSSSPSPLRGERAGVRGSTAIVSLVAWGGVGKTMLVQHWLQRLQRQNWFGVRRVYAWSFYSQGTKEDRQASEDPFLAHALEWFGVQCEPTLSPWDKGRLLADVVSRERTIAHPRRHRAAAISARPHGRPSPQSRR